MLLSQVLDDYNKNYPIYGIVKYAQSDKTEGETLHPLFTLTQYIIDKFVSDGHKRIAIILPNNECTVVPLLLTKYLANIQYKPDYAGSVLDDIQPGQHLRLGKAVVEFLGIDEKNQIKFRVERRNSITVTCPINGIHYLFEKTEGALSSWKVWCEAKKAANQKLSDSKIILDDLRIKRTALRKTMLLLSAKNDFRDFTESLYINGLRYEEVATYGEIDLDSKEKFKLYNKGRLDCLPSISVTAKTEELYYLLKDEKIRERIDSIYSTMNKFDEIIDNPDTFKKILKYNIPFIVFLSESNFEGCPLLTDFGFALWHWKPSTMQSKVFLSNADIKNKPATDGLFRKLSEKIGRAASAEFILKTVKNGNLKNTLRWITSLTRLTSDADNVIRQLVRKIWGFQNKLTRCVCKIEEEVQEILRDELKEITDVWDLQKASYLGQQTEYLFNKILETFETIIIDPIPVKLVELLNFIESIAASEKCITVVVPDNYTFIDQTLKTVCNINGLCAVNIKRISDFYAMQNKVFAGTDYLVAIWFDKDEYIKIKQTYCYNKLVFILYDYENRWRDGLIAKIDECIPHEKIKSAAVEFQFSESDVADKPFDKIEISDKSDYDDISDYTLSSKIIRSTLGNRNSNTYIDDSIECIPVLLSEDKIGYFYPTHDLIDVTLLASGHLNRPVKKDAINLKKGDRILVRQSGKDIIKERADLLMYQSGETSLREASELWIEILNKYAEGRTVNEVWNSLNKAGGECSFQQVMYWLLGTTIMPRDINILRIIGEVASCENGLEELSKKYVSLIDNIFEAGKKVQAYHQKAGRWLTAELKNKAAEIKAIADKSPSRGIVDGIGEVAIYTVEDVLDKEQVGRNLVNRIEELY